MEATVTVTVPTDTCDLCGVELGADVLAAADLLYGPSSFRLEGLRKSVERALTLNRDGALLPSNPESDALAGRVAVLEALGLERFESLTLAFRHYGQFGECRD